MYFTSNLQFLRKSCDGMTQEKLAQRMNVSRQTVSKWESGEAYPEIGNLIELCEIFSCSLDALLRKDMTAREESSVRIVRLDAFRIAQYIMISTRAKKDVQAYLENWAKESGLLLIPGYSPKYIHWGFPYVSAEQKNRFGLTGHAAAYILPDEFEPALDGPEIMEQKASVYAMVTGQAISEEQLPDSAQLYAAIMQYLGDNRIGRCAKEGFLPCFERVYWKDGILHKDVFVHCENCSTEEQFHFE